MISRIFFFCRSILISRVFVLRMEFDGLYLSEQPEDDDMKGHWDKLVISAK